MNDHSVGRGNSQDLARPSCKQTLPTIFWGMSFVKTKYSGHSGGSAYRPVHSGLWHPLCADAAYGSDRRARHNLSQQLLQQPGMWPVTRLDDDWAIAIECRCL